MKKKRYFIIKLWFYYISYKHFQWLRNVWVCIQAYYITVVKKKKNYSCKRISHEKLLKKCLYDYKC